MKIKEILEKAVFEDVVTTLADMDICIFHEDYVNLGEVFDEMKTAKVKPVKYKIVFKKAPNGYPVAMKKLQSGSTKILLCTPEAVVDCEIENHTDTDMKEKELLVYTLLHFVSLQSREIPYEFLKTRFEANEEDE